MTGTWLIADGVSVLAPALTRLAVRAQGVRKRKSLDGGCILNQGGAHPLLVKHLVSDLSLARLVACFEANHVTRDPKTPALLLGGFDPPRAG